MLWFIFALTLLSQNISFTIVSRARNSGSYKYNFLASLGSNGTWFVAQFFVVGLIAEAIQSGSIWMALDVGLFYITFTSLGSVLGQYVSKRFFEKGRAKVGA